MARNESFIQMAVFLHCRYKHDGFFVLYTVLLNEPSNEIRHPVKKFGGKIIFSFELKIFVTLTFYGTHHLECDDRRL